MPQKEKRSARVNLIGAAGISVLGICMMIAVVMLARSDGGQIDVSASIANINKERVERGETPFADSAARTFQNMPNGGLVPTETLVPEPTLTPTETSTSTATSTIEASEQTEGSEDGRETAEPNVSNPEGRNSGEVPPAEILPAE